MKPGSIAHKIESVFLYFVFICYILFLFRLLLLSRVSLLDLFNSHRAVERSFNLIPLHSIQEYLFSSSATIRRFAFANVGGNIFIFIPLGAYLLLFKNNKRIMTNLLAIILTSLLVEIIQGLLGLGTADIDDIILNSLGGFIGIIGYKFLLLILRGEQRVRTAIAILSAIGLPVLLYLLFAVRVRL